MLAKTLLLAALAASVQAATLPARGAGKKLRCGNPSATAEQITTAKTIADEEVALAANGTIDARSNTDVDVYFHVVAASASLSDGYLTVRHRLKPLWSSSRTREEGPPPPPGPSPCHPPSTINRRDARTRKSKLSSRS